MYPMYADNIKNIKNNNTNCAHISDDSYIMMKVER